MTSHERLGSELAGYRIESLIGRGGMSVVYLAEEVHLERRVALKLLAPDLAEDAKFRERFIRESRLAASLEHPNIITVYEAREVEGQLYIAMRYISGGDLKGLIAREGPLDPERTISILSQAASALDAAHAEGLIHRDVKPGNILLNPRGQSMGTDRVYLSDFGLTKRATSDSGITATGQFVGSLDYAAPEQFQGKTLNASTDVYSLGCVLYECLTGEVPFPQENQAALVYAHLMAPPPKVTDKRPGLPPAVDRVVAKALAKNPEDRYATAGEVVEDAAEALGVQAVAPTTPTRPVAAPPRRRHASRPLMVTGAAMVALVVLIVVLVALNRGGSTPPGALGSSSAHLPLADYVARIDPVLDQMQAKIRAGKDPSAVAVGEGSVWVANSGDDTVSRIDPVTSKVAATIKVGHEPEALAVGEGAVWVYNSLGRSVSRIDPSSNRVASTILVDVDPTGSLAVGEGAVWLAGVQSLGRISVLRIDPKTDRTVQTVNVSALNAQSLAVGAGAAWIGGQDGRLSRIDVVTGLVRQIPLEKWISSVVVEGDSVWVATLGTPGIVFKLDGHQGNILDTIAAGGGSGRGGLGAGARLRLPARLAVASVVWITDALNGTLSSIEKLSGEVSLPIAVGKTPTDVAVGQGSVWVAVDGR